MVMINADVATNLREVSSVERQNHLDGKSATLPCDQPLGTRSARARDGRYTSSWRALPARAGFLVTNPLIWPALQSHG